MTMDRAGGDAELSAAQAKDEDRPADALMAALGYLTAFENGPLLADRDFIYGYLRGLEDSRANAAAAPMRKSWPAQ